MLNWVHSRPATLAILALYGLLVAWVTMLGWGFVGQTFPGFLVMDPPAVEAVALDGWSGTRAGIEAYERITAVDGRPLASAAAVLAHVRARPAGTVTRYDLAAADGRQRTLAIASATFTARDFVLAGGFLIASGVCHVLVGAIVLWLRPEHMGARAHWWFCLTMGLLMAINFETASTCLLPYTLAGFCMVGIMVTVLYLAAAFPALVSRSWAPHLAATAVVGAGLAVAGAYGQASRLPWWSTVHLALMGLTSLAILTAGARWTYLGFAPNTPPLARSQARIIALGIFACFTPMIAFTVAFPLLGLPTQGLNLTTLMLSVFPIAVAYAIIRHQLFDITVVLRRSLLYALLVALIGALYAGIAALGSWVTGPGPAGFLAALAVAIAFRPLHDGLRATLDRAFLGERMEALDALDAFARRAPAGSGPMAEELLALLDRLLRPAWTTVTFGQAVLAVHGSPGPDGLAFDLAAETPGTLGLGPRANGIPYTPAELSTVQALATHAAVAFGRARLVEEQVDLRLQEGIARAMAAERQNLLAQVVHDMRSDLANVVLALDLARRVPDPEPLLASAERSVGRMADLLDEKARWVAGHRPTEATVRVAEVAAGVALVLETALAARGQTLEAHVDETIVPLTAVELGQVLINLLSNAIRVSPDGTTLRLTARADGEAVVLAVIDGGEGVCAIVGQDLAAGRPPADAAPGHGLGLANVRALIEPIGGTLAWHNTATGAVFEVALPLVR